MLVVMRRHISMTLNTQLRHQCARWSTEGVFLHLRYFVDDIHTKQNTKHYGKVMKCYLMNKQQFCLSNPVTELETSCLITVVDYCVIQVITH